MKSKFYLIGILIIIASTALITLILNNRLDKSKNLKQEQKDAHKIVIIGGGSAGLSAAVYAARAKLNPIIIQGEFPGGQLNKASYIENWPGKKTILGPELAKEIKTQATDLGTTILSTSATKVDFTKNPFEIWTNDNQQIFANTVIVATGAKPTKLNCPGEEQYLGKGVAVCATCDAPLFKNKNVVVIGGNYSALREIDILTKYTDKITVINKKTAISGPLSLIHRMNDNPNIKFMNNCIAQEIQGDENWVKGVQIFNKTKNQKETIPAEGVFVSVGWEPSSSIFEGQLALDSKKQIKVNNNTQTSVEGVYAAGDVTNNTYHQAPVASAFGYMAAMDAEKHLTK